MQAAKARDQTLVNNISSRLLSLPEESRHKIKKERGASAAARTPYQLTHPTPPLAASHSERVPSHGVAAEGGTFFAVLPRPAALALLVPDHPPQASTLSSQKLAGDVTTSRGVHGAPPLMQDIQVEKTCCQDLFVVFSNSSRRCQLRTLSGSGEAPPWLVEHSQVHSSYGRIFTLGVDLQVHSPRIALGRRHQGMTHLLHGIGHYLVASRVHV